MAPRADEGRGRQRNASGSCEQALIRRYPNGETPRGNARDAVEYIDRDEETEGTETSKYLEEQRTFRE